MPTRLKCDAVVPHGHMFQVLGMCRPKFLCEDSPWRTCNKSCDTSACTMWSSGFENISLLAAFQCGPTCCSSHDKVLTIFTKAGREREYIVKSFACLIFVRCSWWFMLFHGVQIFLSTSASHIPKQHWAVFCQLPPMGSQLWPSLMIFKPPKGRCLPTNSISVTRGFVSKSDFVVLTGALPLLSSLLLAVELSWVEPVGPQAARFGHRLNETTSTLNMYSRASASAWK